MIRYDALLRVSTLAELKTRTDEKDGQIVYLQGGTALDDGLQGRYRFDADSLATGNDDTVVAPTGMTRGRFIRVGKAASRPTANTPTSGTITMQHFPGENGVHTTKFTLAAARILVTDAAASGSYGALKLCTLPQLAYAIVGVRQDYTAFAENISTGAGDVVFDIGVGSVAIAAAADGALAGTDDDIGTEVAITLSSGTGTGTGVNGSTLAINGTGTAGSFNLNWSGTAATVDANGYIDVTGTIEITWADLGDD